MLLIHDDDSQLLKGRKDCRTRPHQDIHLAFGAAEVLLIALSQTHAGMHHRHLAPETGGNPQHSLIGQGNLRDQQDHLPPPLQHLLYDSQVDLRFAGARNTEQEVAKRLLSLIVTVIGRQSCDHLLRRRLLLLIQCKAPILLLIGGQRIDAPGIPAHAALHRQNGFQALVQCGAVLPGHPDRQLHQLIRHGNGLRILLQNVLDPLRCKIRLLRQLQNIGAPGTPGRAEGHLDLVSHLQPQILRHAIGIGMVQRLIGDIDYDSCVQAASCCRKRSTSFERPMELEPLKRKTVPGPAASATAASSSEKSVKL